MEKRLPPWFKKPFQNTAELKEVEATVKKMKLNTVCVEAACPNRWECWSESTATVMILGDMCTWNCRYCNVKAGKPLPPDPQEPEHVALAAQKLNWDYVVVTSVTRDDLPDRGAGHWAEVVKSLKSLQPEPLVELLTPEFSGKFELLDIIADTKPEVWGHNVEIVPKFYPKIRPKGDYLLSLQILSKIKENNPKILTKSSLMIGIGETREEIIQVCKDLRSANVDVVVLGQYLSPSHKHWIVEKFYTPEEFQEFENELYEMGFKSVLASPWARSSYRSNMLYQKALKK